MNNKYPMGVKSKKHSIKYYTNKEIENMRSKYDLILK